MSLMSFRCLQTRLPQKKTSDSLFEWCIFFSTWQISQMKKTWIGDTPPKTFPKGYPPFFDSKFFIGDPPLAKLEISHPRFWVTGHVLFEDVQTALKNMHTLDSWNFLGFWDIHFENPKILGIICCLFWILGLFILRNRWLPYIRSEISKLLMQKKSNVQNPDDIPICTTKWLIGIFKMAYYNPHVHRWYSFLLRLNK